MHVTHRIPASSLGFETANSSPSGERASVLLPPDSSRTRVSCKHKAIRGAFGEYKRGAEAFDYSADRIATRLQQLRAAG